MEAYSAFGAARARQEGAEVGGILAPRAAAVEQPLPPELLAEAEPVLNRRGVPDRQLLPASDAALCLGTNYVPRC